MNITDLFNNRVFQQKDAPAVFIPGRNSPVTYYELWQDIQFKAENLKKAGVTEGTFVGLYYPSGYLYIVLTYALWQCRATVVPIPANSNRNEIAQIKDILDFEILIIPKSHFPVETALNIIHTHIIDGNTCLYFIKTLKTRQGNMNDLNPAFIRFTSGTTGQSKGVILSHETIYDRIHMANNVLKIEKTDSILWVLPMSHHFTVSIVSYLSFGASIILCKPFPPLSFWNSVQQFHATVIYGTPIHYEMLTCDVNIHAQSKKDHQLRLAVSTTTLLPAKTAQIFFQQYNIGISQAYGLIEVGLPCVNNEYPTIKMNSVGRINPNFMLRLEDIEIDEKHQLIWIKGKGMLDAYYFPWQTRDQILSDGWFCTGDLGYCDSDQFLYLTGRIKEVLNVAGYKCYPDEIENVLIEHPKVKEAHVFPHSHHRLGDVPWALVVLDSNLSSNAELDLKKYCSLFLASEKIPQRILFVDELPKNQDIKIIRNRLKEICRCD